MNAKSTSSIESGSLAGLFAPGMRLMGNMQFGGKALLICLLFLLPTMLFGYFFASNQNDQMNFTAQERAGVVALQRFVPVYTGVLKTRNATRATLGGFDGQARYLAARNQTDQAITDFDKYVIESSDAIKVKPSSKTQDRLGRNRTIRQWCRQRGANRVRSGDEFDDSVTGDDWRQFQPGA